MSFISVGLHVVRFPLHPHFFPPLRDAGMEELTVSEAVRRGNVVVFFDVAIAGAPAGRIRMELFASIVPRTVENFRQASGRGVEGERASSTCGAGPVVSP
jgi:hypothetical protein